MQCPLHHKNILLYNPTSLCIKGLITTSKSTSDQKLRSKQSLWFKGKVYHYPGQHHDVALAQRGTCDLLHCVSL